ncbi:hypothetical protein EV363DRAFT_1388843 [Boletus edulis]|nr:hypothetical protein EV363DRAFT_1388843 [Boletus edulis]
MHVGGRGRGCKRAGRWARLRRTATSMQSPSTRARGGRGTPSSQWWGVWAMHVGRSGEARTSAHGPCASGKARANDSAWAVHGWEGGGGPCASGERCRWWGWRVRANDGRVMTFVHVGRVEGAQAGEWSRRRHGDRVVTIVTSSLSPHRCCEHDDVRARTGQGEGQAVTVASEGERQAPVRIGRRVIVRGRAGDCRRWRWRARASGGTVEAPTRPQTTHSVIFGDEAPARHGLSDLLLLT